MPPGKRSQAWGGGERRAPGLARGQEHGSGGWDAHLAALLTTSHVSGRVGGFPDTLEAGCFYFRRKLAGIAKPLPFSWRLGPDECSSGYFWLQTIVICNPKFTADLSACGTLGLRGCGGGGLAYTRWVAVSQELLLSLLGASFVSHGDGCGDAYLLKPASGIKPGF